MLNGTFELISEGKTLYVGGLKTWDIETKRKNKDGTYKVTIKGVTTFLSDGYILSNDPYEWILEYIDSFTITLKDSTTTKKWEFINRSIGMMSAKLEPVIKRNKGGLVSKIKGALNGFF